MDHGIDSVSNRNYYQEYFLGDKGGRCVGLTILPNSRADCLEIWEPHGTLRVRSGIASTFTIVLQLFTFLLFSNIS